ADAAVNAANALQAQAHEFFSKSDLADGEEKERLMQQGYNLLLGRSGGRSKEAILIESQAAFDQVSYLESSINIARAKVEHLTDGIAGINSQMPGFERTASAAALRGTINDISSQQARLASEIASQMGEVEKAATRFVTLADEVVALCEQARQEFSLAAGGRRVDPGAARFALADSQHRSAMLIAAIAASHEMLATHAESIAPAAADGYTMRKLQEMASQHSGKRQQLLVSASALLDEACESYKAVSGMSRPAMCAALSGNILAYLERLRIASQLRETVTQVSMTEQLQALDARGLECGEEFAETLAGRMLADVMTSAGIPRATPIAPAADEYEREPAVPANAAPVDRPFVRETPDPNRPRAAAEDPNFSY
ncbi:MAG TPA: hypothetical protein VLH60_03835, partial [Sedimentisphaerales bacterium]|nr:hypothetical protein [Sedimentisphaerales bacterium]